MQPNIPFGLASKLMTLIAAIFGAIGAITAVVNGELTADSIYTLSVSVIAVFILAGGRYAQAALGALNRHLSEGATDTNPPLR
jgi:hypothetical protein